VDRAGGPDHVNTPLPGETWANHPLPWAVSGRRARRARPRGSCPPAKPVVPSRPAARPSERSHENMFGAGSCGLATMPHMFTERVLSGSVAVQGGIMSVPPDPPGSHRAHAPAGRRRLPPTTTCGGRPTFYCRAHPNRARGSRAY